MVSNSEFALLSVKKSIERRSCVRPEMPAAGGRGWLID
jgi:hypothetical protein